MKQTSELKEKIEKALEIDWAINNIMGKPDKVQIIGYPKGGYHLTYEDFIERIAKLLSQYEADIRAEVVKEAKLSCLGVVTSLSYALKLKDYEISLWNKDLNNALDNISQPNTKEEE